jgi:glycosyltransferase involved in cell wall biosynthesis
MNKALVMISSGTRQGGAERRFGRAYTVLVRRDPSVHMIVNRELYAMVNRMGWLPDGTPNIHVLTNWRWLPQRQGRMVYLGVHALEILWLVMRLRLRLLHLLGSATHVCAFAAFVPGLTVVMSIVSDSFFNIYSRFSRPLYSTSLHHAKLVDVLSNSIVPYVMQDPISFGGLTDKMRITACSFTDYSRFVPAADKQPWVVFSGFMEAEKNPLLAAQVACRIVEQNAAAQVFLLGRGPLENAVRAIVGASPHAERITMRHEPDVAPILTAARVYLAIRTLENYPTQALLEAMASGCAIVATDVGDTRLLVDDSDGVLVSADVEQIANAALALLADPGRCAQLGAAARERATTQHTVERMVDYLQALYADASGEQPGATDGYKPRPHGT